MFNWDKTFTFNQTTKFLSPGHQLEVYAALSKSSLQPSSTQINAIIHLTKSSEPPKILPRSICPPTPPEIRLLECKTSSSFYHG